MFILASSSSEFQDLLREQLSWHFVTIMAISGACLIAIVAIVGCVIGGVVRNRAREATKRELAAYVAEGTLDPDQAVAMINAGRPTGIKITEGGVEVGGVQ